MSRRPKVCFAAAAVELVVTLKTATKLGTKIPQSILLRTDRVVE